MIELTIQEIRKKQKFVRFLKENNAYYKFIKYFIPNAFVWNHTDCPQLWDRLTNKEKYLRYD